MSDSVFARRRFLSGIVGLAFATSAMTASAATDKDDLSIDNATALLFSDKAPLKPEAGKRDASAVWACVPSQADATPDSVLVYLHGNNNYVTVDAQGHSRVPDWAADDATAHAGAAGKPAAPLSYKLDRIESRLPAGRKPLVLVPEDATLAHGAFWAREPAGQYKDPKQLGKLIDDCCSRLSRLSRPEGKAAYLPKRSEKQLKRVCLSGHSGAGLPLPEAAVSERILPEHGIPADLWLLDSTYWSNVAGFVEFCTQWHKAERLAAGKSNSARFVCIYRPHTQTEPIADTLRGEIAAVLGVAPETLVRDHDAKDDASFDTAIRPALVTGAGVLFIRTTAEHDSIPTFFLPRLLETAAVS